MKGIKKLIILTTSIFSVTTSSYTFAIASFPKGVYFNGDIGLTRVTNYAHNTFPSNTTNVSTGKAWSGGIGYKFTPYIGVQADYNGYADTRIKDPATTTAARDAHHSIDLTSMIIFPIYATGFELYGKLGLAWISSRIGKIDPNEAKKYKLTFNTNNQTAKGLYWGLGGQYYFNQNVAAHIQYAQAQGSTTTGNLAMTSIGLSILFDLY